MKRKDSRRDFLRITGTTLGGMLFLPKFLTALPLTGNDPEGNILVIIQLNGGNDGLNTYIPFEDPAYYDLRKSIAIPAEKVLKVSKGMGWNPVMEGFMGMQQDGNLSVIQNVGYPNPDRSHFRSMEIWNTGADSNQYLNTGWLGRALDANCGEDDMLGGLTLAGSDNLAMKGEEIHSITLTDPEKFERQVKNMQAMSEDQTENPNLSFVRKLAISAFDGVDEIKQALENAQKYKAPYPAGKLGRNLEWISNMIKGKLKSKVYYTSMSGFDTHADQLAVQRNKLGELSQATKAFYDDMKSAGLLGNVTLLIFSEFGRRVAENGSKGTDHGKAAPVFVIGGNNKGTQLGKNPRLDDLDEGDLRFDTDFRSVYSTLLKEKLGIDPAASGLEKFGPLTIF
jgi:uncharacterized protein (DUF1501 family)